MVLSLNKGIVNKPCNCDKADENMKNMFTGSFKNDKANVLLIIVREI
jgi:hypothetical protein